LPAFVHPDVENIRSEGDDRRTSAHLRTDAHRWPVSILKPAMADTLTDLSKEAKHHWADERWGEYRNVRYETAEHVRGEADWQQALYLYVEVMVFDLQGVASGHGSKGFSRAYQGETPSVAREIARVTLQHDLDKEALEAVYGQVADEFWVDAFPRSRPEVWEEMWEIIQQYRDSVRLKERIESLGPDQLLSPTEAETYAEQTDDYELIQRVGTLLENESPAGIPWKKRKRAHDYLSAVDIDHVGNRWKAKAYRWAGEVVLSNDEKDAALTYFEKALDLADLDDRATVKRRVNVLREELGQ
jgi:hypothetical protein